MANRGGCPSLKYRIIEDKVAQNGPRDTIGHGAPHPSFALTPVLRQLVYSQVLGKPVAHCIADSFIDPV